MSKIVNINKQAPKILSNQELYKPLVLSYKDIREIKDTFVSSTKKLNMQIDAIVTITVNNNQVKFLAFNQAITAPKSVQATLNLIDRYRSTINQEPLLRAKINKCFKVKKINYLLIVPFMTDAILELAKEYQILVLDLSGNYNIIIDNFVAINRSNENQFKDSKPIKNIFSGNSSLVPRFLLINKTTYNSVNEIHQRILRLGGQVTLSTVSKVLTALENDLMISKENKQIKVIQADKILNALTQNYIPPTIENEVKLKIKGDKKSITSFLIKHLKEDWVLSGDSSANLYTVTTEPTIYTTYTKNIPKLPVEQENRFYNLVIKETTTPYVYFDLVNSSGNEANELQTYLALSRSDKREQEIAQTIKKNILRRFE